MRVLSFIASLSLSIISVSVHAAAIAEDIQAKIVSQGVPADAVKRMSAFLMENEGRTFTQSVYSCAGKDPASNRPCEEEKRTATTRDVTLETPETVAIIDFSMASTDKRFFLINVKTGAVSKYLTSHGVGTSRGNYTSRFSNTKDSRQTSLGFYLGGGIYQGHYGNTMRLYGLQTSNDAGYNRDIVLHGAWYVSPEFANTIDPTTKRPYGRIGVSWGCPAVSLDYIDKLSSALKDGGVLLHYHPRLMEEALKGKEVMDPEQPIMSQIPIPTARPEESLPEANAEGPQTPEAQANIQP